MSLHRLNVLTQRWVFVGLENYIEILPGNEFLSAFGRTAYFAVVTVLGGLIVGMGMALVLNARFAGRGILRSVVLIPWAMSPVAVGILWNWIFNGDYGPLNALLLDVGYNPAAYPLVRERLGRLQRRGPRADLEPSAAHLPVAPGRLAVDAGKPSPRGAD